MQQELDIYKNLKGTNHEGFFEESRFIFKSLDFTSLDINNRYL